MLLPLPLVFGLLTGGCDRSKPAPATDENQARRDDAVVILASDDLKNLAYLQPDLERVVGRKVQIEYSRVTDMADRVNQADAAQTIDIVRPTSHH
ncbi:MAG: hypothetical protein JWR16_3541, partial [Nevskia sp.]|nr:hypothetical protein [Nevskia sp.]